MIPQSQHLLINVKIGSLSDCLAAKMLLQLSHNSASKRERCLRPSHSLGVQATFTSQHHRPHRSAIYASARTADIISQAALLFQSFCH